MTSSSPLAPRYCPIGFLWQARAPVPRLTEQSSLGKKPPPAKAKAPMNCYDLHTEAMSQNQNFYNDPKTGYRVFTERGHLQRGVCCGCGCRHCPFGHERVPLEARAKTAQVPTLLSPAHLRHGECDVLFWSGGKDSYLTLLALQKELENTPRDIVLLNTFDGNSRVVAHQEIPFEAIVNQGQHLRCSLIAVPLYAGLDYMVRIREGLLQLRGKTTVKRLVFGDLHLEHIRSWREEGFAPLQKEYQLALHFPLWKQPYSDLLETLEKSGAIATLSAAPEPRGNGKFEIGMTFNREFIARLPEEIDSFGENGEFHTVVSWPDTSKRGA